MRFLTEAELHAVVDAVDPHYRPLVVLAALTGLRFSELAGLKARNVDVLGRRISVVEQLQEVGGRLEPAGSKTRASKRTVAGEEWRMFCDRCPVLDACRAYAMSDPGLHGNWAGMTKAERAQERRQRDEAA